MSRCRRGRSRRARAASSDFKRAVPRYACVRTAGRYWFASLVPEIKGSLLFFGGFFPWNQWNCFTCQRKVQSCVTEIVWKMILASFAGQRTGILGASWEIYIAQHFIW